MQNTYEIFFDFLVWVSIVLSMINTSPKKALLEGFNVAILVTDNFEWAELVEPKKSLENAGAKTVIIAPHTGVIKGVNHDKPAGTMRVDLVLDEASPEDFDAVLLPGGAVNADQLRMNEDAQEFITTINDEEKPIAVICHGAWLLVSAGLVAGRRLTSFYTIQDDIKNAGGQWEDTAPVRDENWVSARSPEDIPQFNKAMIALFAENISYPHMSAQI